MPIEIFWYIEKRVLTTRLSGEVTAEDMIINGRAMDAYIKASTPPLFLIIDQTEVTKFAPSLRDMSQGIRSSPWMNANIEYTILISNNKLFSFFGVIIGRIMGAKLYHVTSLDGAFNLLNTHFPTLDLPDYETARAKMTLQPDPDSQSSV